MKKPLLCLATTLASLSLTLVPAANANVIGSDAQNFNPTTSGLDFVTVQSSETLEPGILNLGLFLNYAVNTLPFYPSTDPNLRAREFNDSFLGTDFNFGLGLMKSWDMGLSFPVLLSQDVKDTENYGYYSRQNLTEIRLNSKLRLWGDSRKGIAVVGTANFNQIKNNPYIGAGGGPTLTAELAGDFTIEKVAFGLNVGYRWRDRGTPIADSGIEPMPNQFIASAAASYLFTSIDTKLITEIYTSNPVSSQLQNTTDRQYSSMELLIGAKHDFNSNLAGHVGTGFGLSEGVASPDYRVYAGLNWVIGPLWNQKKDDVQERPQVAAEAPSPAQVADSGAEPDLDLSDAPPIAPADTEEVNGVAVYDHGDRKEITMRNLNFKFGTAFLLPESREYLRDSLLKVLQTLNSRKPIKRIVVKGHTDSVGTDSVNLELSQFRADAIKKFLEQNMSKPAPRIDAKGFGEQRPIADNGNYQGRRLNRRVEFEIFQ